MDHRSFFEQRHRLFDYIRNAEISLENISQKIFLVENILTRNKFLDYRLSQAIWMTDQFLNGDGNGISIIVRTEEFFLLGKLYLNIK